MERIRLQVETYSGSRADERPTALVFGDRRLRVDTLVDTWYGQDHLYFKVLVEGGDEYVVRRDDQGEWAVHSYRAVR